MAPTGVRWAPWVPIIAGGLAVGLGAVFAAQALGLHARLSDPAQWPGFAPGEGAQLRSAGLGSQFVGGLLLGGGALAALGGVVWLLAGRAPTASVSVALVSGGGFVVVRSALP